MLTDFSVRQFVESSLPPLWLLWNRNIEICEFWDEQIFRLISVFFMLFYEVVSCWCCLVWLGCVRLDELAFHNICILGEM